MVLDVSHLPYEIANKHNPEKKIMDTHGPVIPASEEMTMADFYLMTGINENATNEALAIAVPMSVPDQREEFGARAVVGAKGAEHHGGFHYQVLLLHTAHHAEMAGQPFPTHNIRNG